MKDQIIGCKVDFPSVHWRGVSNDAIRLIKEMLQVDPNKRITVSNILEHSWLEDPAMRSTVKKLMYPFADVSLLSDMNNDINNTVVLGEESDQVVKSKDADEVSFH